MGDYKEIYLPDIVGRGYKNFWEFKNRYRVVKGGRGSKKSTTASLWIIYNMMKYYHEYGLKPCVLVLRRYFNTHRDSTFAQLKWAIHRLQVNHLWTTTMSPLEMRYLPSGQKILFRGLDDPQSITSIVVEDGFLCWTWWEEAFQITNEDDFNKVDLSIRGEIPVPLFKQHTLTFNPWSEKIWLKQRFFDNPGDDILSITRNYDCNEFLGDDDRKIFQDMKERSPRRYDIEGLGNWGIAQGLIYNNWMELDFDANFLARQVDSYGHKIYKPMQGMDFGYTNHPTAFIAILVNQKKRKLFIYDEFYKTGMSNQNIYDTISYKGFRKSKIGADSEDPRTINELKILGLPRIYGVKKPKGSVKAGIQKLQDYKMYVHPSCVNTIVELSNYVWDKDKMTGQPTNEPIDDYNHLMDALRYATEDLQEGTFSW